MTPEKYLKMEFKNRIPLKVFPVGNRFILAVYQGSISEYDILVKFRQKHSNNRWSKPRTPKHIHWAIDVLIKMSKNKKLVEEFLTVLIEIWEETISHTSYEVREKLLNSTNLMEFSSDELSRFRELDNYGDYSIEFLVLLAKLLMQQEKNNRKDAFLFKKLLESLRKGEDIFDIVSRASYRGRKK